MSKTTKYLLISLPTSITPSSNKDDALDAVSTIITPDNGTVSSFPIPEFKIGTLDALVQQADELAKLESSCQGVVAKISDALNSVLEGDQEQVEKMKNVNDSMWFSSSSLGDITSPSSLCQPDLPGGYRACRSVFKDVFVE